MKSLKTEIKKNIDKTTSDLTSKFLTIGVIGSSVLVVFAIVALVISKNIF